MKKKQVTKIEFGKYKGTPIKQLPHSYLRHILLSKKPPAWADEGKKILNISNHFNDPMGLSRHAIDRFSLRFIKLWQDYLVEIELEDGVVSKKPKHGIGTFLVKLAEDAWKYGADVSKNRYKHDGIVREYKDMKFVFHQNEKFPEYKELITIM